MVTEWDLPRCLDEFTPGEQRRRALTYRLVHKHGRLIRVETVNGRGYLTNDEQGIASTEYEFAGTQVSRLIGKDRNGVVRRVTKIPAPQSVAWFDFLGRPLPKDRTKAVGLKRELDAQGHVVAETYVDANGAATSNAYGTFQIRKILDSRGVVLGETYHDSDGTKQEDSRGVHREIYGLDGAGFEREWRYFGIRDEPVLLEHGYHRRRWYYNDLKVITGWSYWGLNDEPVRSTEDGAHACRVTLDKYGSELERTYLDEAGRPILSKWNYATRRILRNAQGLPIEWSTFGAEGGPILRQGGHHVLKQHRDQRGNVVREEALGIGGELVIASSGYAIAVVQFNERDHPTFAQYFDPEGKPLVGRYGYAMERNEYDGDRLIRTVFFDPQRRRVDINASYAELRIDYDSSGLEDRRTYFDSNGRRIRDKEECAATIGDEHKEDLVKSLEAAFVCAESGVDYADARVTVNEQGTIERIEPQTALISKSMQTCLKKQLEGLTLGAKTTGCATFSFLIMFSEPRNILVDLVHR